MGEFAEDEWGSADYWQAGEQLRDAFPHKPECKCELCEFDRLCERLDAPEPTP